MKQYFTISIKILIISLVYFLAYQTIPIGNCLIVVSFLMTLLLSPNYSVLIIPLALYYQSSDILIYIIAGGLAISLRHLFFIKKTYTYIFLVATTILSNVLYLILYDFSLAIALIGIPLIMAIYGAFMYTLDVFMLNNRSLVKINNYPLFSAIFIIIMSYGAYNITYGFSFIVLFIIYLSYIKKSNLSFALSAFGIILYPSIGFLLPFISLAFSYTKLGIACLSTFIFTNLMYPIIGYNFLLYLEASFLLFLLLYLVLGDYSFLKSNQHYDIYTNLTSNFNDQILKFASFLEEFKRNFVSRDDSKMSDAFQILINTFCSHCPKMKECFFQNKNETYLFLRDTLLYGNNIHVEKATKDMKLQIKRCQFSSDVIQRANSLKNKYNLGDSKTNKEKSIEAQINGLSNTLRQYAIDLSCNNDIDLNLFISLRQNIIDYGYHLILFNIRRYFHNDFLIEIGISHTSVNDIKEVICPLAHKSLGMATSTVINKTINDSIYFSIIPKINYSILYGHGCLAKNDLNISGDNYLIKDDENGKFLAALSDGMGSGYKAYNESKNTLHLVDKITSFEINTATSLNMLNTFYSLKDTLDTYATLDLIEINKSNGKASLYKMGSSDTIYFSGGNLKCISNTNLPVGINDLISDDCINILHNDLILLMSDGVRDNLNLNELKEILLYSHNKHPQKICFDILDNIIKRNNNIANDDMSLVVLKVEKLAI